MIDLYFHLIHVQFQNKKKINVKGKKIKKKTSIENKRVALALYTNRII